MLEELVVHFPFAHYPTFCNDVCQPLNLRRLPGPRTQDAGFRAGTPKSQTFVIFDSIQSFYFKWGYQQKNRPKRSSVSWNQRPIRITLRKFLRRKVRNFYVFWSTCLVWLRRLKVRCQVLANGRSVCVWGVEPRSLVEVCTAQHPRGHKFLYRLPWEPRNLSQFCVFCSC